jgi:hypothetical protein
LRIQEVLRTGGTVVVNSPGFQRMMEVGIKLIQSPQDVRIGFEWAEFLLSRLEILGVAKTPWRRVQSLYFWYNNT